MDLLDVGLNLRLVEMHHAAICFRLSKASFSQLTEYCREKLVGQRDSMLGKLIVYASSTLSVTDSLSNQWWAQRWGLEPMSLDRPYFADIPCAGTSIAKGDPILTVLTTGKTEKSILQALQAAKSIEVAKEC